MQEAPNVIPAKKKHRFANVMKAILFNVLGFYIGYYLGYFARYITTVVLVDWLGQIRFLTALLSYPVEYETYALTGIIFADAAASLYPCAFISRFGHTKRNYSCFVLGAVRIFHYVVITIESVYNNGFDLSAIWTIAVSLIGFAVITIGSANNEEI